MQGDALRKIFIHGGSDTYRDEYVNYLVVKHNAYYMTPEHNKMHAIVDTYFKYNGEKSVVVMKYQESESRVDKMAKESESRADRNAQEAYDLTRCLLLGLYSTPKNVFRVFTRPTHVFVLSKFRPKNYKEWESGGGWTFCEVLDGKVRQEAIDI